MLEIARSLQLSIGMRTNPLIVSSLMRRVAELVRCVADQICAGIAVLVMLQIWHPCRSNCSQQRYEQCAQGAS